MGNNDGSFHVMGRCGSPCGLEDAVREGKRMAARNGCMKRDADHHCLSRLGHTGPCVYIGTCAMNSRRLTTR